MTPRLKQPLFGEYREAAKVPEIYDRVRAYDMIWNLVYHPEDITREQLMANARVNLACLGEFIEKTCGPEVFEHDPRQLTFPEEILG